MIVPPHTSTRSGSIRNAEDINPVTYSSSKSTLVRNSLVNTSSQPTGRGISRLAFTIATVMHIFRSSIKPIPFCL